MSTAYRTSDDAATIGHLRRRLAHARRRDARHARAIWGRMASTLAMVAVLAVLVYGVQWALYEAPDAVRPVGAFGAAMLFAVVASTLVLVRTGRRRAFRRKAASRHPPDR